MTDGPDRIWAEKWMNASNDLRSFVDTGDGPQVFSHTEYIRKDLSDAAMVEALTSHRQICESIYAERDDADKRAGAAWRMLGRYKFKVRELNAKIRKDQDND